MAGVVFIICIPTEDKEKILVARKSQKKSKLYEETQLHNYTKNPNQSSNNRAATKYHKKFQECNNVKQQSLLSKRVTIETSFESDSDEINIDTEYTSMKKVMENILKQLKIENSVWSNSTDGHYIQIIFTLESGNHYEEVLDVLKENQIGLKYNSVVSVTPCTLYYKGANIKDKETPEEDEDDDRTLCAIGLVENSNIYLLSSMLISPMMGPVMAATFGTVIRDRALQKMGVQNELLGLGIAVVVGFCYGTIICLVTDKYGESDWPTNEMISRGEVRTIGVGCLIALLSGAAVALGVLSDNIASLVGVAISTSLMPPAVNAGLLWSLASVYYLKGNETTRYSTLAYTNYYSDNRLLELSSLGAMSLCLTFGNIICIYVAGLIVFKIKEVAPIASKDHIKRRFWNHDIKITRDYNKTLNNEEFNPNEIPDDFLNCQKSSCVNKCHHLNLLNNHLHHSIDLSHTIAPDGSSKIGKSQYTWSPCMDITIKPTIKELQDVYFNRLIRDKSTVSKTLSFAAPLLSQDRRLSQGYTMLDNDIAVAIPSDESLRKIEDNSNENIYSKSKKFIVTPCSDSIKKVQF